MTAPAGTGLAEGESATVDVRAVDRAGNVGPEASIALTPNYGPRIVGYWPDVPVLPGTDYVDLTFNEPINPASFTVDDVSVWLGTPPALGFFDTGDGGYGIQVVGTLAYVAALEAGLQILDLSDPTAPALVGVFDTPDKTLDVFVVDTLAYVADDTGGVRIVDVSDPANPMEVGQCDLPGQIHSVYVEGPIAYAVGYKSGLCVLDVSEPTGPVQIGHLETDYSHNLQIVGSLAYVADDDYGLRIVDISDPANPMQVGRYDTSGYAQDVEIVGDLAYVAAGDLVILDVSDPAAPVQIGYASGMSASGVQIVGSMAFVACSSYTGEFRAIDVTDPTAPVHVSVYQTTSRITEAQVVGDLAYVTVAGDGLRVLEVSRAAQQVSQIDPTTYRVQIAPPVGNGTYKVFVGLDVSDLAGNTMDQDADGIGSEATQDRYVAVLTIDETPPAAPGRLEFTDDTGILTYDKLTADADPTFTWTAASDVSGIARYEYRIDGGEWMATTATSATVALADGPHTFEVRAVDNLGLAGSVASIDLVVDATAPAAPAGPWLDGAMLKWGEVTDVSEIWRYNYRINGGSWINFPITQVNTGLAEGATALFEVRAVNKAGNAGEIAPATMTIDYGPSIIGHSPDGAVLPTDSLTIVFDEPIDPATFTSQDIKVFPPDPILVGGLATSDEARDVVVVGTLAYVVDDAAGLQIMDVSDLAAPVRLGSWHGVGRALDVVVSGTLGYLAYGSAGLRILDVSDPTAPVLLGTYDTPYSALDVSVVGTLAYVADERAGMLIIDVSDPAVPVLLGEHSSSYAYGVDVHGTLAYMTVSYGLRIIDVSDPSVPVQLGYVSCGGPARGVTAEGTRAYVASGSAGVAIVDVSDPAAPVLLGAASTPGYSVSVAVSGNRAYVADGNGGLRVADMSDPTMPVVIGAYDTSGDALGVALSGGLVYLTDGRGGLRIFDVPRVDVSGITQLDDVTFRVDLAQPLPAGSYHVAVGPNVTDQAGNAMDQDGDGIGGEAADDVYGFDFTVDPTLPPAPQDLSLVNDTGASSADRLTAGADLLFAWSAATAAAGYEFRVDGGVWTPTLWISEEVTAGEGPHVIKVRAISSLGNPGPATSLNVIVDLTPPDAPTGLEVSGSVLSWDDTADANGIWKYQYRIDGGQWIDSADTQVDTGVPAASAAVFDVRAFDNAGNVGPWATIVKEPDYGPRVVGHSPDGAVGPVDYVEIAFDEAIDPVTISGEDVRVLLAQPARLGGYDTSGYAYGAVVAGTTAYVAVDHYGLQIVDVSDPAAPVWLGGYDTSGNARGVAVAGTTAYVADGFQGLVIIDVTDPAAPVRLGVFDTAGYAYDVTLSGGLAYVADDTGGLQIIDVADPAAPVRLGGYDTTGRARGVMVVGSVAYVANERSGLQIIDVSNPVAPVRLGGYDTAGNAYAVAVSGTVAYVADYTAGLQIIDVSNPAAPVRLGGYNTPGFARDVAVAGGLVYVADDYRGLLIIDAAIPAAPQLVAVHDTPGNARTVVAADGIAYLADGYNGLEVIDVQRPVTGIAQVDDATFRAELAGELSAGDYAVRVGPNVAELAGNLMDQDANGAGGEVGDVLTFGFTTTGPAPLPAPAPVARPTAFQAFLAPGTTPAGSALMGPLPDAPTAAAFAGPDESSPSPAATAGQDAAGSIEPLASAVAVTQPASFGQFLCAPADIDLLCDSPMPLPSLAQLSALPQASATEVDLLDLQPTNLEVIPALLPV